MSRADIAAKLVLEATVSPSEDPEKVAKAMGSVLGMGGETVSMGPGTARLVTTDLRALEHLRDQLRDRRIRSAARRQMLLNRKGESTSIMLNRQAAAAGVVAVCGAPDESPLGPIYLSLSSERLDEALDWVAAYSER